MRYINSYINIDFEPNVTMRTVYMNTYPHIIIVCTKDLEIGDELLLDYGKAYTDAYLTPKPKVEVPNVPMCDLPGFESDADDEQIQKSDMVQMN